MRDGFKEVLLALAPGRADCFSSIAWGSGEERVAVVACAIGAKIQFHVIAESSPKIEAR